MFREQGAIISKDSTRPGIGRLEMPIFAFVAGALFCDLRTLVQRRRPQNIAIHTRENIAHTGILTETQEQRDKWQAQAMQLALPKPETETAGQGAATRWVLWPFKKMQS
mgnify:CR=1 FL=1